MVVNSKTKMLLGQRLKELRRKKNLKQEQLAELAGFNTSNSISNIENGYNYPSLQNLEKILNILDSSFLEIFDFDHHQSKKDLRSEINKILDNNPEKIQDFYKIIRALTD